MAVERQRGLCAEIDGQQASVNVKMHEIYAYFFLGMTVAKISTLYRKGKGTISRWISRYKETGDVSHRSSKGSNTTFSPDNVSGFFVMH
jgi:transposase